MSDITEYGLRGFVPGPAQMAVKPGRSMNIRDCWRAHGHLMER